MGGHHKKNLRAEKAKVKLKGIKLPKGLNVTKTDFKVRKITIRDQISASQVAASIDGHQHRATVNLKETLSRLKHHSSSFRLEALRSLRDAIAAGHSGLASQLGEIVQGVAAACLDIEKETRRESFKTLSALLAALHADTVAPFFHVISSYLRCAMTHIQATLQEDALLMLDVLLQHVPRLVAAHSAKIFQNFLEMISRVRAEGDRAGRTLTVHLGAKQTTIKWRSQVLARLQQMLQTLVVERSGADAATAISRGTLTHTFAVKEPQHYSLKRSFIGVCDLGAIFSRSVGDDASAAAGGGGVSADLSNESQQLRGYVTHLMPLLLEAWLEVRPPESSAQVILSADAALTLKIVLEITENLWTLVELHEAQVNHHDLSVWFRQKHAEAFNVQLLQAGAAFPYQQTETVPGASKKSKKSAQPAAGGQFCLPQNLSLAYLMCRFYPSGALIKKQSTRFSALLSYLHTIISSSSRGGGNDLKTHASEHLRHLELALRALLHDSGAALLQLHADGTRALLRGTIVAFLSQHFPPQEGIAGRVLVLLCNIAQCPQLRDAYGAEEFNDFLVYLPQLLLRPSISEAALVAMSNLGKQRNAVFLGALVGIAAPVIAHIQRIQISGAATAFEGKKHIMNLFYWTPRNVWDAAQREELVKQVDECITDKRIVGYYKFILTQV